MKSVSFVFLFAGILLGTSCSKTSPTAGIYNGEFTSDGLYKPASCEVTVVDDNHLKLMTTIPAYSSTHTFTVSVTQNEGSQVYNLETDDHMVTGTVAGNVLTWQDSGAHHYGFHGSK